MRPLLSRLTPPRPLRALQQPTTTTARTPTRRNICTTVTQRFWGVSTPADPTPPVEEAEVGPRPDPVQEQGYVPRHDGRGLRVVGIVGKLGKRVQVVNVESFPTLKKVTDPGLLEALLRRAVVETYTNVLYGKKADEGIVKMGEEEGKKRKVDFTRGVDVVKDEDGGFRFLYGSEEILQGILRSPVADKVLENTAEDRRVVSQVVEVTDVTMDTMTTDTTTAAAAVPAGVVTPEVSRVKAADTTTEATNTSTTNTTTAAAAVPAEVVTSEVPRVKAADTTAEAINTSTTNTTTAKLAEVITPEAPRVGATDAAMEATDTTKGITPEAPRVKATDATMETADTTKDTTLEAPRVKDADTTTEATGTTTTTNTTTTAATTESTNVITPEASQVQVTDATMKATDTTTTAAETTPEEVLIEEVVEEVFPSHPSTTAWYSLPLPPPHLFAIHKRLLLTTGHRLSDQALTHSPTAHALLKFLLQAAAPPPEKLDLLSLVPELSKLGNVRVLKSRLRPVDREIEKGRLSPAQREWLENKRRKARGEEVEGGWTYQWDEGKYFVP